MPVTIQFFDAHSALIVSLNRTKPLDEHYQSDRGPWDPLPEALGTGDATQKSIRSRITAIWRQVKELNVTEAEWERLKPIVKFHAAEAHRMASDRKLVGTLTSLPAVLLIFESQEDMRAVRPNLGEHEPNLFDWLMSQIGILYREFDIPVIYTRSSLASFSDFVDRFSIPPARIQSESCLHWHATFKVMNDVAGEALGNYRNTPRKILNRLREQVGIDPDWLANHAPGGIDRGRDVDIDRAPPELVLQLLLAELSVSSFAEQTYIQHRYSTNSHSPSSPPVVFIAYPTDEDLRQFVPAFCHFPATTYLAGIHRARLSLHALGIATALVIMDVKKYRTWLDSRSDSPQNRTNWAHSILDQSAY